MTGPFALDPGGGRLRTPLFLLAALAATGAFSAEPRTAAVSALEGRASRSRAGRPTALSLGAAVAQGDILTTEESSRLELKLGDGSALRLGPRTRLQLSEAHFGGTAARRRLTAKLFFGNLWARVTSLIQGEQKFAIETENAVAGVRGTTFRVDARADRSVLVRVYDGAVAVGGKAGAGAPEEGGERHEVQGPEEVSRERWEKIVGRQMQIVIAADGTPGEPEQVPDDADKDDAWARWNQERDGKK